MNSFDIEKSVGFLLAKAHQRIYRAFRDDLKNHHLTPPQFALLAFLWKKDNLSQAELSEKTEVDRTTIGGLVDRLEKVDLVTRCTHPSDRRAYLIHLTEKGRSLEKELTPLAIRARERIMSSFSPGEYERLCELLEKLRS